MPETYGFLGWSSVFMWLNRAFIYRHFSKLANFDDDRLFICDAPAKISADPGQ